MSSAPLFALDSNCFTYLVTVLQDVIQPTDSLANEKTALLRSFLYTDGWHFLTPTVDLEWRAIPDPSKRELHESWNSVLFGTLPVAPSMDDEVEKIAERLFAIHPKERDCRILAEAEVLGADKLLSYDHTFVNKLSKHSSLALVMPSQHWESLNIPESSPPKIIPRGDNPHAKQSWWRW